MAAMTNHTTTTRPFTGIRATLEQQWEQLNQHPRNIRIARGWHITTVAFSDLNDLLALAGFGGGDENDHVLWALVSRAAHDDLATHMVLRRILPGLMAANRRRPRRLSAEEGLRELIAAAWITIRTYDPNRDPSSLAAALIDGARYRAFRSERRRRDRHPELPSDSVEREPSIDDHDDLLELRHVLVEAAQRGLPADDLELVRRLATGHRTETIANELGITTRAVRYRCTRIANELAAIARVA